MTIDPARALTTAQAIISERYPGADFAFVAGSIMRGEGTQFSDIDLVVIYRALPAAYRESFQFAGVPIEAFVHDPDTLEWFIDQDAARGRPGLFAMVAEGVVIGKRAPMARAMQSRIKARLAAGPPPLSPEQRESLLYRVGDLVDDLRAERTPAEQTAIGAGLYAPLAELSLRGRGCWNGAGKWIPRLLKQSAPELAARFEQAFTTLFTRGDTKAILALAEEEIARQGGPVFKGFRRDAPPTARRDARSPLAAEGDPLAAARDRG